MGTDASSTAKNQGAPERSVAPYGPFALISYPCPLCGSAAKRNLREKAGRAYPHLFAIVACVGCGHVRVDPRISDECLDDLYDEAYYRGNGFDETVDYTSAPSPQTVSENEDIIASVASAFGGSIEGLRWLDIGCGMGTLLAQARSRGAIVSGHDASPFAADACRRAGLHLVNDEQLENELAYDVVTAIEVIEHVPDPTSFLRFVASRARPGGIVFLRTGNWHLVSRLPGSPYLMPEGHIQYFTPRVMRKLFREASLAEANVFNRTWFVWKLLPDSLKRRIPIRFWKLLASATRRVAPAIAPFPIGKRVAERQILQ